MLKKMQQIFGNSVKENEPLKNHTTFKIGGPAKYFFVAESEEEIVRAVKAARKLGLDYFILGGGSNVLVSDNGFDGLVIQIKDLTLNQSKHGSGQGLKIKENLIEAGAGVSLQVLVQEAAKVGLSGLEYAVGIPGTLGGAIFGNAGGRHWAIGEIVKSVKILWPFSFCHSDPDDNSGEESRGRSGATTRIIIEEKNKDWMEFGYRTSKIKKFSINERPVILSAVLELKPDNPKEIKKLMSEKMFGREKKLPKEPSAGCIFKNLPNTSVGQLIDSLGLKGKCVGDACVSNLHANFIVNKGNATAKDVKELIDLIKETAKKEKGIELVEEIQYLGFS